jgi:hypothetical protein
MRYPMHRRPERREASAQRRRQDGCEMRETPSDLIHRGRCNRKESDEGAYESLRGPKHRHRGLSGRAQDGIVYQEEPRDNRCIEANASGMRARRVRATARETRSIRTEASAERARRVRATARETRSIGAEASAERVQDGRNRENPMHRR